MPTQAERRAATEGALLDATLDALADEGWAALSTRGIAERAGVAQSTQRHYWPTKAAMIMAAIRHAKDRLAVRALQRLRDLGDLDATTVEQSLDLAWELHRRREYRALQQVWLAAANDPEIATFAADFEAELAKDLFDITASVFPRAVEHPDARAILETGLAAVRGIAALVPLLDDEELERRWETVRPELVRMVTARLESTPLS